MSLNQLYNESVYIIREAVAKYNRLAFMWAGGKDSTLLLYLGLQCLPENKMPPAVFLDTTFQFRETYDYIRTVAKAWNIKLIRIRNTEALACQVSPDKDRFYCCTKLKTEALNQTIKEHRFEALFFGIRRDEHAIRGKEYHWSLRDLPEHMRVHPLLNWSLGDVWEATREWKIPVHPLYKRVVNGKKYKSLGCWPCTEPTSGSERSGRAQDKEHLMGRLRALGYM